MTREERLLTFEKSQDGESLDIHLDEQGLDDLLAYLTRLRDGSTNLPRHEHLMTPSWGGNELSEELQGSASTIVHSVTIRLWPNRE